MRRIIVPHFFRRLYLDFRRSSFVKKNDNSIEIVPFRGCNFFASRNNKIESALRTVGEFYDWSNFIVVQTFVHEGAVCIDVGANIGVYSSVMARLVGHAGAVHAFEPVCHVRQKLLANVQLNGHSWIEVNECALGDGNDILEMHQVNEGEFRSGTSSFVKNENFSQMGPEKFTTIRVTVKTLDRYVEDCCLDKIDFVKLDVEGFELKVLLGGEATIDRYGPTILMEYDSVRHGHDAAAFIEFFERLQYETYEFITFDQKLALIPFSFDRSPSGRNILCFRPR